MKDYNKISICNLLWLAEYQCKGVFQPKILVLTINFFSLNLISREIEGDRASFSQNKRTLQGRGGVPKNEQGQTRGEGVKTRESWANILFECPLFILIVILSSILFMYILIEGLSVTASYCLEYLIPKWSIRYSNFFIKCWSWHFEFIIPTKRFYICPCIVNGKFDKAVYLSFLRSILFARLSNSLSGSDFLLYLEFINIVSIFDYTFTELIILLYTF